MTSFKETESLVRKWAEDRGIYEHSTPRSQLLKAVSEMGELADAEMKDDVNGQIDAVGDVIVCLINYAAMRNFTAAGALECAYEEIKDRKGYMIPGGVFVKEE